MPSGLFLSAGQGLPPIGWNCTFQFDAFHGCGSLCETPASFGIGVVDFSWSSSVSTFFRAIAADLLQNQSDIDTAAILVTSVHFRPTSAALTVSDSSAMSPILQL